MRDVLLDVDAYAAWNPEATADELERMRTAERVTFAHSEAVTGEPVEDHVWLGRVNVHFPDGVFSVRVPMRAVIFRSEEPCTSPSPETANTSADGASY